MDTTATHQIIENDGDLILGYMRASNVFYAVDSLDVYIIDPTGAVWRSRPFGYVGATRIPAVWLDSTDWGTRVMGFIEALA